MRKPVVLLLPAEREMFDAAMYYEQQVSGLGSAFLDKVSVAISDIADDPERWPEMGPMLRRRLVHRFPYAIVYRVDPGEVVVLAVAHLHRRPAYWFQRTRRSRQ